jgi:hypothetical protein
MRKIVSNKNFRRAVAGLIVVLLVGGLLAAWHAHNVHKAQNKSGTIPTSKKTKTNGGPVTKSQKSTTGQANTPSSANSTKLQGSTAATSAVLEPPFGTFVSNHRPGQNGSPTAEQSTCNTTPGATCDIQFTNASGITKSLGAEVTDANGAVYWSWDINGGTLAPGSWHITAVVKLNGQTKTASDPTPLEVQ